MATVREKEHSITHVRLSNAITPNRSTADTQLQEHAVEALNDHNDICRQMNTSVLYPQREQTVNEAFAEHKHAI